MQAVEWPLKHPQVRITTYPPLPLIIPKQAVQACELSLMHFSNSAVWTDPSPVIFLPAWKMRVRESPPRLVVASRDRSLAVNK